VIALIRSRGVLSHFGSSSAYFFTEPQLSINGYSGFCVANLANAISLQGLGSCTAEARLPGGLPVRRQTGGQALRAQRRSDFGLKQLFHHKEPSAAKPQPKGRRDFTAETRSSQSSECILTKKLFTLRPPRLRGEPSDNLRTPRKLSRIAVQSSQRIQEELPLHCDKHRSFARFPEKSYFFFALLYEKCSSGCANF
jgi:hypothetical protein